MRRASRYISDGMFFAVLDRDDRECVYCGRELFYDDDEEEDNVEIDHKLPISRGGTSDFDNLQATCGHCNERKGDKTHEEYLEYISVYGVFDEYEEDEDEDEEYDEDDDEWDPEDDWDDDDEDEDSLI